MNHEDYDTGHLPLESTRCNERCREKRQKKRPYWKDGTKTNETEQDKQKSMARLMSGSNTSIVSPQPIFRIRRTTFQRIRYDIFAHLRCNDSNLQAGPVRDRPDWRQVPKAMLSINRELRHLPFVPLSRRARRDDKVDLAVKGHLKWLSENWQTYFAETPSSSTSTSWSQTSTWWNSQRWEDHHQWREWRPEEWQDQQWRDRE